MAKRRKKTSSTMDRTLAVLPSGVIAALVGYFLFHALFDDKGLFTLMALKSEREQTEVELRDLMDQRRDLESRVTAMRTESLDLDLLEEQARSVLGLVHEDELVVMLPNK